MKFFTSIFIDKLTKKKFKVRTGFKLLDKKIIELEITSDSHPAFKKKNSKNILKCSVIEKFIRKVSTSKNEIDGD
ncbi:hypothetical protein ACWNYH_00550 [Candidatus Vidania fulgoroideorum]